MLKVISGISGALFSDETRIFRYALWRIWDSTLQALMFVGLNPSTAAETRNDPTVVRMVNFAKSWGFGSIYMANLRSIVSAHPRILLTPEAAEQPGGPNDEALKEIRGLCSTAVVGWGEFGRKLGERPAEVLAILGEPVYCLKVNPSGEPTHPLYLPNRTKLILYSRN